MILGLGIDVVEIDRIRYLLNHYGKRFLDRIYTSHEVTFAFRRSDPAPFLAVSFAAKEASSKALGTGLRGISWREIEVCHHNSGKPYLVFYGRAKRRFLALGGVSSHLSLSHEKNQAIAVVIIEGEPL